MIINAEGKSYKEVNDLIRKAEVKEITLENSLGHRFVGNGVKDKTITINGIAGNCTGSFLDGGTIRVFGNAQDEVGNTMNKGTIYVHGSCGDVLGYGMRGGEIYVRDDAGYRCGIHMKSYKDNTPVMIIGGCAGSFVGEYLAGGKLIILGLGATENKKIVRSFCGAGMYAGEIYLRTDKIPDDLPANAAITKLDNTKEIETYLKKYCDEFHMEMEEIQKIPIYKVSIAN